MVYRGVACSSVPPHQSLAASRPTPVGSQSFAEPLDLAMASPLPLLCLCVAAAQLAMARGEMLRDPEAVSHAHRKVGGEGEVGSDTSSASQRVGEGYSLQLLRKVH